MESCLKQGDEEAVGNAAVGRQSAALLPSLGSHTKQREMHHWQQNNLVTHISRKIM